MTYKKGWILVNDVPTMVRTWGGWIEDDIKEKKVLLFITGNPGVTDFYIKFLSTLNFILQIPVWVVCHAGNQIPPPSSGLSLPPLRTNQNKYNLQGQVDHKKIFLNKYLGPDKKIILVGHSVGGKIAVELLKDGEINRKVEQAHLMFPTLESFSSTPNAWLLNNITFKIAPALKCFCKAFSMISYRARYCFIRSLYFLRLKFSLPTCIVHGIIKLLSPEIIKHALFLAQDEMKAIKDLDHEIYENNANKLFIYYGYYDRWTEPNHFEKMKNRHPQVNARVLDSKFRHAFTFYTGQEMADILCDEIKKNV